MKDTEQLAASLKESDLNIFDEVSPEEETLGKTNKQTNIKFPFLHLSWSFYQMQDKESRFLFCTHNTETSLFPVL